VSAIARIGLCLSLACTAFSQVNILTANGNNDRTNGNLQEVQLNPSSVSPSKFGKLAVFPVDGQVYAQPLYISSFVINGAAHNVVFIATMHNGVYAFDAESTSRKPLWQVNLGASVPAQILFGPYGDIGGEVGILSTPVIDPTRGIIYVVTDTMQVGAPAFFIHALDLATGAEKLSGPVLINGAVPGVGSGAAKDGTVPFDPKQHIQRPALLLANGAVYVAFGSHGDLSPFHGWLMSYDAGSLRQLGIFMSTPNGDGGAFWQSGRGIAADDSGTMYAITGNGDYDGAQNFGQSLLKLSGSAPGRIASFTAADWKSMSDADADISAGPTLISGTHTMLGADKSGNLYILDGDSMGKLGAENTNAFQIASVAQDAIFSMAVWSRPGDAYIYVQAHRDTLKCFQWKPSGFNQQPVSAVSYITPWERVGMTVSANGFQDGSGILWETTGNFNDMTVSGTLHAYDAQNLSNELWSSDQAARDTLGPLVKFASPTVANGKVFVPTLGNAVMVYGLLSQGEANQDPPVISAVASGASYTQDAISPGQIVSIFGAKIGPTPAVGMQLDQSGAVTSLIGDTQVMFDGVPAPMVWASAGQINAVAPFRLSSQTTQVQVQYQGQISDTFEVPVAASAPGIFSLDSSGSGQAAALNQDGSVNGSANPAPAGSVVVLYATGVGLFSPPLADGSVVGADTLPVPLLPVYVDVAGSPAKVLYAGGAPGAVAGVLQVNLEVPAGTPASAATPVSLRVGDGASQPGITIATK
jgi:uncharacterized protein (TIGR03437 family)